MPMRNHQSNKINRYTTLPVLLDLLKRKKLVLLNPSTWEDRNDAEIIMEYKKRKNIRNLFAICFGVGDETVHHWKAYADGISGCCIEFDKKKLLESFKNKNGIRYGNVIYRKINDLNENTVDIDRIPFIKRWPYRCENEFRILWEGRTNQKTMEFEINLHSINKITLSQRIPVDVSDSVKDLLRSEIGDPSRKINRSTLYENNRWIKIFKR